MEQLQLRDLYHSTFKTNIFKTGSEDNNNASIMPLVGGFPFNLAASMRFFPVVMVSVPPLCDSRVLRLENFICERRSRSAPH